MALSDTACRKAAPTNKPFKLSDGGGMYLFVHPNGGRYWRLDYRHGGKRKTLALGTYPDTSLADAREKRTGARKLLAAGTDPSQAKQEAKRQAEVDTDSTFEAVARRWHASMLPGWDDAHAARVLSKLERDIFPQFGHKAITSIEPPEVLEALRKVEARGAIDVTKRTRQYIGRIFRFAIAEGIAARDPAADVRGALKTSPKTQHRAKLEANDVPEFLRRVDAYDGEEHTQLGLKLIMLTLVRTSELRFGEWCEFSDLDGKEPTWRIPAAKMKMDRDHIVALPHQALPILKRLRDLAGKSQWLLPSNTKTGVISENTLLYAIYRMGYHSRLTTHGLRGTASTILNENDFNEDWIEMQLSHEQKNKVRAAYNAAKWLPQRRKMLQWWADYLDDCRKTK